MASPLKTFKVSTMDDKGCPVVIQLQADSAQEALQKLQSWFRKQSVQVTSVQIAPVHEVELQWDLRLEKPLRR